MPSSSFKSSSLNEPSTLYVVSLILDKASFSSVSYSSRISPTISSSRSSVVIIPDVVPYSLRTMAMLVELNCISLNRSEVFFCSNVKNGFLIMFLMLNVSLSEGLTIKSLILRMPITLLRVYIVCLNREIISSYDELTSARVISILGIITSLAVESPKSNRLLMIFFSLDSITPSCWLTLTMVRISSSVNISFFLLLSILNNHKKKPARWSTMNITGVRTIISTHIIGA